MDKLQTCSCECSVSLSKAKRAARSTQMFADYHFVTVVSGETRFGNSRKETNGGNFEELMRLRAQYVAHLQKWFARCSTWISHDIQDEIATHQIQRKLAQRDNGRFA
eukprot:Pompholyxophrys_sp_v1_NODE_156_length_1477_cov_16.734880.p4 type:complete len:107 gc:universal NODE_156_length_1477_cov_16.734880:508-828(+)